MSRCTVRQAMHPSGLRGRLFATLMERLNYPAYKRAFALMAPSPGDTILEIGFGTGALLSMLVPNVSGGGMLAGLDPSPVMVAQARARLVRHSPHVRLDLREGRDQGIDWPPEYFSHVAALHSFQFWSDPALTLCKVRKVLRPGGQLVLILRSHLRSRPDWLPNPLSRSSDEVAATIEALRSAGFGELIRHPDIGSSAVITARVR